MASEAGPHEVAASVVEILGDIIAGLAHPENQHRSIFIEIRRPELEDDGDGPIAKQYLRCRGTFEDLVEGARDEVHMQLEEEIVDIERECEELVE